MEELQLIVRVHVHDGYVLLDDSDRLERLKAYTGSVSQQSSTIAMQMTLNNTSQLHYMSAPFRDPFQKHKPSF